MPRIMRPFAATALLIAAAALIGCSGSHDVVKADRAPEGAISGQPVAKSANGDPAPGVPITVAPNAN